MTENITLDLNLTPSFAGDYDVIVCGGGPAGFIAATAAAREGAKTALIERYGFLGGMATAGFVNPISVFTYNKKQVIGGIPWEFVKRLEKAGGCLLEEPLGNVAFSPEYYKLVSQDMVIEAGVDLYMHSYISHCIKDTNKITHIIIENKNGTEALSGKIFIDCTGDADLAFMAGVPMQESDGSPLQPLSSYFILGGVNTETPMMQTAIHHNRQGENCHCLPVREKLLAMKEKLGIGEFGGPWFCTAMQPGVITVNITRTSANACDNRDFTSAEHRLRRECFKMAEILKQNFDEFKDSYLLAISVQAGIRETRRIKGMHIITGEEYLNAVHYEDSIARGAHPIDIHASMGASQSVTFLNEPAYVPFRSLVTEEFPNIIIAGRCLSADKTAFASLRVQASCMDMGQAAGIAAAQCSKSGASVQNTDIEKLISRLKETGSII